MCLHRSVQKVCENSNLLFILSLRILLYFFKKKVFWMGTVPTKKSDNYYSSLNALTSKRLEGPEPQNKTGQNKFPNGENLQTKKEIQENKTEKPKNQDSEEKAQSSSEKKEKKPQRIEIKLSDLANLLSNGIENEETNNVTSLQDLLVLNLLVSSHAEELERGRTAPIGKMTKKRIQNELKDIHQNPPVNWRVIDSSEWNKWIVQITVEDDSPFNTLPILLNVSFPNDYPYFRPFLFLNQPSRFFHPNIYKDGSICEELINENKNSTLQIRERIDGFVFILSNANPESPANNEAAELFRNDFRSYRKKAFKIFRQVHKLKKAKE